jgi:hypothetical protein
MWTDLLPGPGGITGSSDMMPNPLTLVLGMAWTGRIGI